MNVMCRIHVSTTATTSWAPSSASVNRDMSSHRTRFPVKVKHMHAHTHMLARTHNLCIHYVLFFSSSVCVCVCVQTLMNAASPATCVSISVSTALEVTPVSVQRDISSRDSGYVKVLLLYPYLIFKKNKNPSHPLNFFRCHPVTVQPVKMKNKASLGQRCHGNNAKG